MCGIAGFIGKGDLVDLKAMSSKLISRGPDDQGSYVDKDKSIYLFHSRLAITDIKNGQQPMFDNSSNIIVIFNGQIYNSNEIRANLVDQGYNFKTSHCDTEVLINGYKKWGVDLLKYLNGMFAFVIYDKIKNQIFLARDRFGEKPLFYYFDNNNFIFSSQLDSLISHRSIKAKTQDISLQKYFAYGYVPEPLTIYSKCYKLQAGNSLLFDITKKSIYENCYWQFSLQPDHSIKSEESVIEELDMLLANSVKQRLKADVDPGLFLSGGIDSSLILYYSRKFLDKKDIKTFTVGFNEESFDESKYAKQVAGFFGVKNYNKALDTNKINQLIPKIINKLDEPINDPSLIATYFLSNHTQQHVKFALSGDGSDELFAGYDPFSFLKMAQFYHKIVPDFLHKKVISLARLLPVSHKNMSWDFKINRGLRGLSYQEGLWNPLWLAPISVEQIGDLFYKPIRIEELYSEVITLNEKNKNLSLFDKTLEFYTKFYLKAILTKSDRASMMNSLEVRSVFLDNKIADFCMSLPNHFKFKKGIKKYILKKLLKDKLPQDILNRKKKGFGVPIANLITKNTSLVHSSDNNVFNISFISQAMKNHQNKTQNNSQFLYSLLIINKFINEL